MYYFFSRHLVTIVLFIVAISCSTSPDAAPKKEKTISISIKNDSHGDVWNFNATWSNREIITLAFVKSGLFKEFGAVNMSRITNSGTFSYKQSAMDNTPIIQFNFQVDKERLEDEALSTLSFKIKDNESHLVGLDGKGGELWRVDCTEFKP